MTKSAIKPKPDAISLLAAMQTSPRPVAVPVSQHVAAASTKIRHPKKTGARAGTRQIAGHFPDATLRALKHVMAEEDTTLQALLDEAIDDLLVKKGRAKLRHT
jgi:hypothetical protein